MALTPDDVKSLINIIDSAEHLEEIELTWGDVQLHLWRSSSAGHATSVPSASASSPVSGPSASTATASKQSPSDEAVARSVAASESEFALAPDEVVIRAPMLGTFYRSPSPGEPTFVEVGQTVGADDTVCLIEVMKLFNSIRAGVDGTVVRILRQNGTLVEFGDPLIVIRSASERA